jgi:quercetin dioxygenase-like cupin family protein
MYLAVYFHACYSARHTRIIVSCDKPKSEQVVLIGGPSMKSRSLRVRLVGVLLFTLCAFGVMASASISAEEAKFAVEPLVEKKVKGLPPGALYWRLENFPTLAEAESAAGATSLAAEVAGKVWLFTLGPKDGSTPGGTKVTEIGPIPPVSASEYLLRVNRAGGPPGVKTSIHTHPGPEAFYVLAGKLSQKTPHGVSHVEAGSSMVGHGADTPMEVSSVGTTALDELAIFVVDANRPFSSPAKFD